ncbi:hypothetical protein D3C71_1999690 [compost metagenome]
MLTGLLSDLLQPMLGQQSLRYALLLVSLPVLGAVLLLVRTLLHTRTPSHDRPLDAV